MSLQVREMFCYGLKLQAKLQVLICSTVIDVESKNSQQKKNIQEDKYP